MFLADSVIHYSLTMNQLMWTVAITFVTGLLFGLHMERPRYMR